MARNKKRDTRYSKSRAVKESAKNAAKASALKRRQQKEEREGLAGDQEPVIDFDTLPEAQDREEEAVAVEEPVKEPVEEPVEGPVEEPVEEPVAEPDEEPGQELVASQRPELDQDPEIEDEPSASEDDEQKAGTEEEEPVVEPLTPKDVTVQLERLDLSPATLQRLKRVQKAKKRKEREDSSKSGSSPPKRTRSQTRRPISAGSSSETADPDGEVTRHYTGKKMPFLEFKRNVTMGLLSHALNENKNKAGRAGRMMPTIHPSTEPGAKRRKSRLSVRDDIRFTGVGLHLPIFGEARGRCEWCQITTKTKLESRPFSKCKQCNVFLCLGKKRNCFVEFHDENYLFEEEAPLAEVEAVYSASDGQASDHEPTNKECSSSSADSDELEDTNRREGFIIDEYDDFQQ
ncbi:hypothetical protein DAPPUDRAFT_115201 [Daphnia pulex]|uniref:PiggyBac transposable element-derived protein 4 C-terminal zinc-ribbon domain-containing protein n=1 Tax=Daphnia pulex TaxID=6669 RepID=E9HKK4_DAPPU|nr:hypothetical protein DAPPUDRAFT_115201 [Daphnia pulex]|eukprot:EFX67744.1 hypothetical protein DAPPUDRAFT_115201 [Daphnia pulex]